MSSVTAYQHRPGYVLKQAQQALRLAMDRALAAMELTTPQYAALSVLQRDPELSNAELARRCFVTPQTMHRVVETLEQRGLVYRDERGRGRQQRLKLTSRGGKALAGADRLVVAIEAKMFADIAPASMRITTETLSAAVKALNGDPAHSVTRRNDPTL